MNESRKKSIDYWNRILKKYEKDDIKYDDWLSIFKNIIVNVDTPIIDLGCGNGNDTRFLIELNKKVISCDLSINALHNIKRKFAKVYDTKCFDMLDGLPFVDNYTDLIIADLSLHYFLEKDTYKIINEIKRVLTKEGHLIFRVNSINDINHGAGKGIEIEKNLFVSEDGIFKRFFTEEDIKRFFKDFIIEYLEEEPMNRYTLEKMVYRVCVKNNK